MESIPISQAGYELVMAELDSLKAERPGVIQAIKEAREEGDLSENAGYDAARERQGMLEAKISHLESRIPSFTIIDPASMDSEKIAFSATVELEDMESGETRVYTLMGPDETDYYEGSISILSPVGRSLLGKVEGDEAIVDAPRGRIEYEVLSVAYNAPTPTKKS